MEKFKFSKKTDNLFKAVLSLESIKECERFFRDLCTIKEIKDMSERWEIVQQLINNKPYREIAKNLNISTTTVSRVAAWLNNGEGGYNLMLNKLKASHRHNSSSKKRL